MSTVIDPKAVARQVWQDMLRDGLMELSLGAYLLLTGIFLQADLSALFILLIVTFPSMIKAAKERFTYPRIGYVKLPEREKNIGRYIVAALVAAVLALALVVLLSRTGEKTQMLYRWVPLLPALILVAALVTTAQRSGLMRFHVMAALALAVGLTIPFVELPRKLDSIALYLMVVGPIFLLWGAVIFINFLRAYPVRTSEAQ